jgi:hypothetical protein
MGRPKFPHRRGEGSQNFLQGKDALLEIAYGLFQALNVQI